MIKEEIREAMRNAVVPAGRTVNPQAANEFLIMRGFPEEAAKNQKIVTEILGQNIRQTTVRGVLRFQIAKGAPSFRDKEGKLIKAGQFLPGTTKDRAIKGLKTKTE